MGYYIPSSNSPQLNKLVVAEFMTNKVTIRDVYIQIENLRKEIKETYVTKGEFAPVRSIVYGMVTLIVTAFVIGLLAQIVKAG